jgi:hypothetical protein
MSIAEPWPRYTITINEYMLHTVAPMLYMNRCYPKMIKTVFLV